MKNSLLNIIEIITFIIILLYLDIWCLNYQAHLLEVKSITLNQYINITYTRLFIFCLGLLISLFLTSKELINVMKIIKNKLVG